MRNLARALLVLMIVALIHFPARAEHDLWHRGVIGCVGGEGELSNQDYAILGTGGQACVGTASGDYDVQLGFWFQPFWLQIGVWEDYFPSPLHYWFGQNYPNPFNPATTIDFTLPKRSMVTITVYDVTGREMLSVFSDMLDPGYHSVVLRGGSLSSGVYYCRMTAGEFTSTRKLVLVK